MPEGVTRTLPPEILGADLGLTVTFPDPKDATEQNLTTVAQRFRGVFERYYLDHAALYNAIASIASKWPQETIALMPTLFIVYSIPFCLKQLDSDQPQDSYSDDDMTQIRQAVEVLRDVFQLIPKDFFDRFEFTVYEDGEEDLPRFSTTGATSLTIAIAKPVRVLTKFPPNQGNIPINVGGKARKTVVMMSLDMPDEGVTLPASFSPYDQSVFRAVCSEVMQGNDFIWPKELYYTMTGRPRGTHVSPKSIVMIERSLEKMMVQLVTLDYAAQLTAYKRDDTNVIAKGAMLPAQKLTGVANGQKRSGYKLLAEPPLLKYSRVFNHIITVPLSVLDAGGAVQNTEYNIPAKHYLAERVELAKNPNNPIGNTILFDTVAAECGLPTTTKQQQHRNRTTVKKILDHWKSDGYIKHYKADARSVTIVP